MPTTEHNEVLAPIDPGWPLRNPKASVRSAGYAWLQAYHSRILEPTNHLSRVPCWMPPGGLESTFESMTPFYGYQLSAESELHEECVLLLLECLPGLVLSGDRRFLAALPHPGASGALVPIPNEHLIRSAMDLILFSGDQDEEIDIAVLLDGAAMYASREPSQDAWSYLGRLKHQRVSLPAALLWAAPLEGSVVTFDVPCDVKALSSLCIRMCASLGGRHESPECWFDEYCGSAGLVSRALALAELVHSEVFHGQLTSLTGCHVDGYGRWVRRIHPTLVEFAAKSRIHCRLNCEGTAVEAACFDQPQLLIRMAQSNVRGISESPANRIWIPVGPDRRVQ